MLKVTTMNIHVQKKYKTYLNIEKVYVSVCGSEKIDKFQNKS